MPGGLQGPALEILKCQIANSPKSAYAKLGQRSLKIDSIQFSKTNRYQPNLHLRVVEPSLNPIVSLSRTRGTYICQFWIFTGQQRWLKKVIKGAHVNQPMGFPMGGPMGGPI